MRIAAAIAILMARRYEIRPSICRAIEAPTKRASNSGRLISKMLICTSLAVIFFNSSFSLSTSCPAFPMMIPGRAVVIVTVMSLSVRSIMTFDTLALARRACMYFLILSSSAILSP